jgi:Uma2 family endonuclease
MSSVPTTPPWISEEEFLSGPETMQHVELLDGEVIVSPSPTIAHQQVVRRLLRLLEEWVDVRPPAFLGLSPLDLRIAPYRILQPDLFVICDAIAATMPINAVPELIIEVLSSNRSYDRLAKRFVYEQAGVHEYWMVDIDHRCIEVVVAGELRAETQTVRSVALDGLVIDVAALFIN